MIRLVILILLAIVVITLLRGVIGIVAKSLSGSSSPSPRPSPKDVPLSGELKRDPVCGMYVPVATSIKKQVGGQTLHFCSEACRDRHTP